MDEQKNKIAAKDEPAGSESTRDSGAVSIASEPELSGLREINFLAEGGMSTIYKAYDPMLDRTVAIKVLKLSSRNYDTSIDRFERESKTLGALAHVNIVTVHRCGVLSSGLPYMIMDYISGINLKEYLEQNTNRSGREFSWLFSEVLQALIAAHQQSIIHRDIKPENIMITSAGTSKMSGSKDTQSSLKYQVRLLDFGIAKIVLDQADSSMTGTTVLLGTPHYMSPEQCTTQKVDARSDIYSLACIMFEYISGRIPFASENPVDVMYKRVNESPSVLFQADYMPRLSTRLRNMLLKALATAPEARYQSAEEILGELNDMSSMDLQWHVPGQRFSFNRNWTAVAVIAILLCSAGVFLFRHKQASQPMQTGVDFHLQVSESEIRAIIDEGLRLKDKKQYKEALQKFTNANKLARACKNVKMQVEALKETGVLQQSNLSNYPAAIDAFKEIVELSKQYINFSRLHFECREWLADAYHRNGNTKEAVALYRTALEKRAVRETIRPEGLLRDRNCLADCLIELKERKEAEEMLQRNWDLLCTEEDGDCGQALLGLEIVQILRKGGNLALARDRMNSLAKMIPSLIASDEAGPRDVVFRGAIEECTILNLPAGAAQYKARLAEYELKRRKTKGHGA